MIPPIGLAAAGGSGLGASLSQLLEPLSTPRRALWGAAGEALGLPEEATSSGSALLHHLLGMDEDSILTQGLGMGAEMLGDPLSYIGLAAGPAGAMLGRSAALAKASAAGRVGQMAEAAGQVPRDRKSTRLNSSHIQKSRMPSSA